LEIHLAENVRRQQQCAGTVQSAAAAALTHNAIGSAAPAHASTQVLTAADAELQECKQQLIKARAQFQAIKTQFGALGQKLRELEALLG
jgi:hypothetical protein